MTRKLLQYRGRYQLTMYCYALGRKHNCEYVVSYGASRYDKKHATYRGQELFVTDSVQAAIDDLKARVLRCGV